MKKFLFGIVLAFILLSFSSCGASDSSKLVGRWVLASRNSDWADLIILNKDGSGVCEGPITWKVENNRLYLLHPSGFLHPEYEYSLSGSELTLTALGEKAVYKKEQ